MANKYNLKDILENSFSDCKSTLELSSLDDRNKDVKFYLCSDTKLEIYDFDLIKNKEEPKSKSPDAIYIRDKDYYIVEFKNQNPCDMNCTELKEKFTFSLEFFRKYVKNVEDYRFIICLVYKNQGNHKQSQRYKQGLKKVACCSLDDINKNDYNNFYSHIITQDVNFYKNHFKELAC